ncbi:zinc-ribbon domain-containing protein [Cryobacterium sp. PAMC25264]|uniref:zinc-ribbon domain-containing protein n=1 Tax=Cryobacterium sp. PAMC25264 TaxID=2861288 RepID=UPI001C62E929|nr:zinc-ribbon domain-containing protein [Cryobacterium sp. PAMC25264]QYF72953.1 zinc ribbon domain-containing protein [Cryobacterium sp. PAMC25264]
MFLLFGSRTSEAVINIVSFVCGYCHTMAEQHVVKRSTRVTLFFIPLLPLSTKHVNVCARCGGSTSLSTAQVRHSLEWAQANRRL